MEQEEIIKEEFSLTPILNPETKEYSLQRFEEIKVACQGFIEENKVLSCDSDEELKTLKKCRTSLRKKSDQIKAARLALSKLFTFQFKELEKMLGDADNELKKLKDEFDAKKAEEEALNNPVSEEPTPVENNELKKVTLVIEYKDVNVIEDIKKLAVDRGCTITEIKEK